MELRALVADDEPLLLDLVSLVIGGLEIDVTRAASGGELLEHIAERPFDVIVTDVSMPWMTGLQVMHSAYEAGLRCPLVVMTALQDRKTLDQVCTLGNAVLLHKPFSLVQLYAALEAVTGRSGRFTPGYVAGPP